MTALYRTKMCILAQVAGTPMHSGTVLIAACPIGTAWALTQTPDIDVIPTLMASPHAFLSANESSSVCIEVPFYSPTDLIRTQAPGTLDTSNIRTEDFADIITVVLNPLGVPTSGTSSVTLSLHAQFEESEFYVPHVDPTFVPQTKVVDAIFDYGKQIATDFLDQGRSIVRRYTGLHNPNVSVPSDKMVMQPLSNPNVVDGKTYYESLSPFQNYHRIVDRPIFNTLVDEMSIKHILSKPVYLGTFNVNSTTTTGTNLWARPITPWQSRLSNLQIKLHNPTEILLSCASCWRGKIKIHIQSSMTNFHFLKIIVAKNYSPVRQQLTMVPSFNDIPNLITDSLEFSAGGQVQTVELPFYAPLSMLPVSFDPVTNCLQHGMYYIYLMQPLVVNGAVPLNVQFNVFMTCEDVELFGFGNQPNHRVVLPPVPGGGQLISESISKLAESEEKMEFEPQSAVVPAVSDQDPILNNVVDEGDGEAFDKLLRPILSIRDIARRLYPHANYRVTGSTNHLVPIRVTEALGFNRTQLSAQNTITNISTLGAIAGLFAGYNGGIKFRVVVQGNADVGMYFLPPKMRFGYGDTYNNARAEAASTYTNTALDTAIDSMLADAYETSQIETAVPALTQLPFKVVSDIVPQLQANKRTVYEVEIPNYNPLRYVGDIYARNTPNQEFFSNCLGSLVISLSTTAPEDIIGVRVYAGITDEARYGFQSISFPRYIPTVSVAYPTASAVKYQVCNGTTMSSTPALTGIPSEFTSDNITCYYAL